MPVTYCFFFQPEGEETESNKSKWHPTWFGDATQALSGTQLSAPLDGSVTTTETNKEEDTLVRIEGT